MLQLPSGAWIDPAAVVAVYVTHHKDAPCGMPWEVRVGFAGWTLLARCFEDEAATRGYADELAKEIDEACGRAD